MKFAHLADCHLGGWRTEELQELNFCSFQKAVEICITEKIDFMLISGDLFDSAYPPIEILKETFAEFKKLHDANIPVYLIAGSHDFSASGKTFLDVLEKAGFCINAGKWEIDENSRIKLLPSFYKDIAIYGYPGKKSSLEVEDLSKIYFKEVHPFTIFMIHTTIKDVAGTLPVDSVEKNNLPLANYYALGHIHQIFETSAPNSVFSYPGPTFPNNFSELADLKSGSFNIVELDGRTKIRNIKINLREVILIDLKIDSGLGATEKIISELDRYNLRDKIVLLKLSGTLIQGKTGDISFNEIEDFAKKKGAFTFLRNISSIKIHEPELESFTAESEDVESLEKKIIHEYSGKNPADFNKYFHVLMNAFALEKNEDEKSVIFEDRLVSEIKNALEIPEAI